MVEKKKPTRKVIKKNVSTSRSDVKQKQQVSQTVIVTIPEKKRRTRRKVKKTEEQPIRTSTHPYAGATFVSMAHDANIGHTYSRLLDTIAQINHLKERLQEQEVAPFAPTGLERVNRIINPIPVEAPTEAIIPEPVLPPAPVPAPAPVAPSLKSEDIYPFVVNYIKTHRNRAGKRVARDLKDLIGLQENQQLTKKRFEEVINGTDETLKSEVMNIVYQMGYKD